MNLIRYIALFSLPLVPHAGEPGLLAEWRFDQLDTSSTKTTGLPPDQVHMEVESSALTPGPGIGEFKIGTAQNRLLDPVLLFHPREKLPPDRFTHALEKGSYVQIDLKGRFDSFLLLKAVEFNVAKAGSGNRAWCLRSSRTGKQNLAKASPEPNEWEPGQERDGFRSIEVDLSVLPEFQHPVKDVTFTLIYISDAKRNLALDNLSVRGEVTEKPTPQ